jgi:hypothetical protein
MLHEGHRQMDREEQEKDGCCCHHASWVRLTPLKCVCYNFVKGEELPPPKVLRAIL